MSLLPLAAQTANDVAQQCVDTETFPLWLRVTHFINFLLMGAAKIGRASCRERV